MPTTTTAGRERLDNLLAGDLGMSDPLEGFELAMLVGYHDHGPNSSGPFSKDPYLDDLFGTKIMLMDCPTPTIIGATAYKMQ